MIQSQSIWSMFGALHKVEYPIESIINNPNIVIIKDEVGIVFCPVFGLNSIGNMMPGEGYQTKLENLTQFSYPAISSLDALVLILLCSKVSLILV